MIFRPTDIQQAELDKLLEQQQDPSSPNYHRWLSPDEFADRFG
jgi:subtilase family serine protease